MATPGIILHSRSNDSALWMKDRQTGTNFFWEREEIKFCAETTVIALVGFQKKVQIIIELILL